MPNTETDNPLAARWIGRVVDDRYKIVELLGEGGMGAVFVAEHLRLRKQVAFKTIRPEFAAHSQAESRFTREALATARIDHPHVASAIDYGPLPEGGAYLVTQLVRGESLTRRLTQGPLPWPQVALLGSQIADALAAAHAIGIVHRDLKPDNILLERRVDGALHARVVDFGIARVSGEHGGTIADVAQPLTRAGAVIGTPGYMAPEQAVGGPIDLRVDLYALGVVLWECVTGQQLWQGDSLTELYTRQLSRPAPSLRGDVPDGLADAIDRLLARTPADRPASAQEVRDELRRLALAGELSGAAASTSTAGSAIASQPTPGEVTVADTRPPATANATLPTGAAAPAKRRGPLWVGAAAALVIAIVLAAWLGGDDTPRVEDTASRTGGPAKRRATLDELLAEVPPAQVEDVKMLLGSRLAEARKVAAGEIAKARRATLPAYIRDLAELELASRCDDKKAIVAKLDEADEVRALASLERLADSATDGCGGRDCLACLRADLSRTIARFTAETAR